MMPRTGSTVVIGLLAALVALSFWQIRQTNHELTEIKETMGRLEIWNAQLERRVSQRAVDMSHAVAPSVGALPEEIAKRLPTPLKLSKSSPSEVDEDRKIDRQRLEQISTEVSQRELQATNYGAPRDGHLPPGILADLFAKSGVGK